MCHSLFGGQKTSCQLLELQGLLLGSAQAGAMTKLEAGTDHNHAHHPVHHTCKYGILKLPNMNLSFQYKGRAHRDIIRNIC